MKILLSAFLISLALISCKKDSAADPNMQIREIAWNYITDYEKSTVNVDWKQAPVNESTYNGISAYEVIFNTTDDALLGPIMVYVDSSTKVALGQALRD
jgi:hypothetical protein